MTDSAQELLLTCMCADIPQDNNRQRARKKTAVGKRTAMYHTRMSELCGEVCSSRLSYLVIAANAFKPKFKSATIY